MTEIGFYHLTRTGAREALPQLLTRTLAAGERAVVRGTDDVRIAELDAALWESKDFLPHGTEADGDAEIQPIWLTTGDGAPNGGKFLFLVDGAEGEDLSRFTRVFDLFDGNDDAQVEAARARWSAAKSANHALTYWQQGARGWEKRG
ncbi:MAG: DNA polymerase III subunit chi [Acetobacteraceae bacterium]|nr:DNA polymerase III subunit chi [Acetobacteraceae bacterium]